MTRLKSYLLGMRKYGPKREIRHHREPALVESHFYCVRPRGEEAYSNCVSEERAYAAAEELADRRSSVVEVLYLARVRATSATSPRSDRTLWIQEVHPFRALSFESSPRSRPSSLAAVSRLAA